MTGARGGAGLRAGLVAGLWVGQAYGVFYLPGFGLAVPAPWLQGTQPPFVTKVLIMSTYFIVEGLVIICLFTTWGEGGGGYSQGKHGQIFWKLSPSGQEW